MPPNPHRVHLLFLYQNGGDIRRRSFTDGDAFFNTISQIFMCKASFFLVFRRNLRFNLIQAAVDLLLVFQNKVKLFMQIIDDELAF